MPLSFGEVGYVTFYYVFACLAVASIVTYFMDMDEALGFLITLAIGIGLYTIVVIIILVVTSPIFRANDYYSLIGEVQEKNYVEEISPIDLTQIPYIDEDYASILGQKVMGEDPALGSKCVVGDFNTIEVNGKLVLVAPLLHTDYFKYSKNKKGTPGYIMVSATNAEDVKLVTKIEDKDIKIKYQPNASFGENLERHIRKEGFGSELLTEFTFELDDRGWPYYVVTTYHNTIGLGAPEADGIIVVDAVSGETKKYSIGEAPEWVDIIQPKEFIKDQISDWGEWVNGWPNFSDTGKLKQTEGMDTLYNNGDCYYYTGITSWGNDDSTTGFIMINTRTKEAIKYNLSGAHENAGQSSARGEVQNLGYTAGFPLPVNIDGIPTYFMPLKDNAGFVKKFAMVNIEHAQIVGVGDNITDARKNYIARLNSNGNNVAFTNEAYLSKKEGTIERISFTIIDGETIYMFKLLDDDNIYELSTTISSEIVLTSKGDKVSISYVDDKNGNVTITAFDNLEINTKKSDEQLQVEQNNANVANQNKQVEAN